MTGLISYGAYIPRYRLDRSEIASALDHGTGGGTRAVACYDEDTTSMGVEAARRALRGLPESALLRRVLFATTDPAYMDKTNANVVHAALRLDRRAFALDMGGSVRSGAGALLIGSESGEPTLVVLSDRRGGLAGSIDERDGGDGAVAFVLGDDYPPIAEVIAHGAATSEFLDRWRLPGGYSSRVWEERFGEHVYGPLLESAFADALKTAGLSPGDVDTLVIAGTHDRAARAFARNAGVAAVASDMAATLGNTGTAHPGLVLADVLDRARPGQMIVVLTVADGASALVLHTTDAILEAQPSPSVEDQVSSGGMSLRYATYLAWRGHLTKEPPRRPDPAGPAAPPTYRSEGFKFGLVGARCLDCGKVQLPSGRVCVNCQAVDRMLPLPMSEVVGTVTNFTIDRLAFSPSPPVVVAVVDFDGGGRFTCEMTDVVPDEVRIGDRVEMTFRRMSTADGIHNYFWKARPALAAETQGATIL